MTKFIVHARRFLHGAWYEEYADVVLHEYRPLTPAEKRAWEDWAGTGLPPEKTVVGKSCWPPGYGKELKLEMERRQHLRVVEK